MAIRDGKVLRVDDLADGECIARIGGELVALNLVTYIQQQIEAQAIIPALQSPDSNWWTPSIDNYGVLTWTDSASPPSET